MAAVELIFPDLKPDQASLNELEQDWPMFMKKLTSPNPGVLCGFHGWVLTENGRNVRDENKKVVVFEWDKVESFTSFITTSQFAEFAASIGHLFTGPPRPQLFRTDTSPKDAASVGKMEILRLTVQNSEATALALQIWEDISVYLKTCYQEGVTVSYGKSQNLADEIVVGLIGWHALENQSIETSGTGLEGFIEKLKSLGELSCMGVGLEDMKLPPVQGL
ncbi:hypothetical protein PDE_03904 [Penicillium oxalicum 114-2]|uniref:ABM domain-containing protein n=1 Tax=Penicillium oxalicum (strain 114-2 / CGMCC 5302) TaxID=933388 RepID=S8ASC2_PENO1|nr:hypothetical protein PDE_03904 [Penicillium oxalicum 114-2]